MGVYIFRSIHAPFIKVGHYSGQNAWSRIAHRGFYSCVCPNEIKDRVSIDDLELLAWFPTLTKKHERAVKSQWKKDRVYGKSEWFPEHLFHDIFMFLSINDMDASKSCDYHAAKSTRRRL